MGNEQKKLPQVVLWRMVRSVLNPTRLRMLRSVYETSRPLCVRELGRRHHVSDPVASIYLRQMCDQGLLDVERHEIKVFYLFGTGTVWPEVVRFRTALSELFENNLGENWELDLMTQLRAFSHFNRLAMLVRLARGPASRGELEKAVGTCVKTMEHHLEFLYAADLIKMEKRGNLSAVEMVAPRCGVSRVLLESVLEHARKGIDYRNVVTDVPIDLATRAVLRRIASMEGNGGDKWQRKSKMKPARGQWTASVITALQEENGE